MNLADQRRRLNQLLAEHAHAVQQVCDEKEALRTAREQLDDITEAQALVQAVAQKIQQSAHQQISSVVSRCLEAVFGEDAYQFKIDFLRRRGKTEARLLFIRDGHEIEPKEGSGGGPIDVASFALRLACLMLALPRKRRLLVMDESFKFINGEIYQERVGNLLLTLAREMNYQFILVSDDPWLKVGKVIEME